MSRLKKFRIVATSLTPVVAIAVNMLESMPGVYLDVTMSSGVGSGHTGTRDVFMMLPDEIYLREGHSVWSIELSINGTLEDTQVFEIDNTVDLRPVRDMISASMELSLVKALIDGKATPISNIETHVFNSDDIVIQKITVNEGERSSLFKGHSLVWTGLSAEFATTAILSHDSESNQVWVRELTQKGVI